MANYKYVGCVTGFSEGGSVQTIAPTEPLYSVTRPANAYTERLVGVSLLVGDTSDGSGGGTIQCTPTTITLTDSLLPEAPIPTKLTIIRNDGEPERITFNSPGEVLPVLALAPDGVSFAFFSNMNFGQPPLIDGSTAKINFAGLASDGSVTTSGVSHLVTEGFYNTSEMLDPDIPPPLTIPDDIVPESNTLAIVPTPTIGGSPSDDLYYYLGGNDAGDPVVLTSCAKAVVAAPNVCTPVSAIITFNEHYDTYPTGAVHARYRVNNGNWIDYSNVAENLMMGLIADFFNTIEIEGKRLIETSGNGGNDTTTATPFRSYRGKSELLGASNSEPLSNGVWKVVTPKVTTIEFAVTENTINDLVFLAFGKDTTVKSCADVIWEGL